MLPEVITHESVSDAIEAYAKAYALLEKIQNPDSKPEESSRLMPTGDQKTGCIGEYWAMRFARNRWPKKICKFGTHSEHGWDIQVEGTSSRIQVKTVSGWSKSRRLSPIHNPTTRPKKASVDWAPWTDLWLIYLSKDLIPTGFWQLKFGDINFGDREKLSGFVIRKPNGEAGGSSPIRWPKNTIAKLLISRPLVLNPT